MAAPGGGSPIEERSGRLHSSGAHLVQAMLMVEKPVVAMANGAAAGLGAMIALLCDAVFMAEEATIGDRHVTVGLVAGDGGAFVWPLHIGVMRAKEMLMTGRMIDGVEARAGWGS
jgi:enoyl-CoA hydratase